MSRGPVTAVVAGFAAGLAAAVLVVGVSAATDAFTGTTTVVRQAAPAPLQPVAASTRAGARLDAEAIYRARSGGVVTITSVLGDQEEISGSGFVVSGDGLVLTNAHVVTNSADTGVTATAVHAAGQVYVTFSNGDRVDASVVGFDLFDDVAVVRVTGSGVPLDPVPLGESGRVRVGEPVAAIGSPFSQAGSLSVGVVSATNRSIPSFVTRYSIPGAIQTDAAINHGNSGGPLFDARGDVIGINAQINSTSGGGEGVGFAVPIDAARRSYDAIRRDGKVSYGWLGVRASTVTDAVARAFDLPVHAGALLEDVSPHGPADDAGLRSGIRTTTFQDSQVTLGGDIVVAVDGRAVRSADDLVRVMSRYAAGDTVRIAYWRGSTRHTARVRLAERPLATKA